MLSAGDLLPNWFFQDAEGKDFSFHTDSIVGHCILIVYCPHADRAANLLVWYAERIAALDRAGAHVYAVFDSADSRSQADRLFIRSGTGPNRSALPSTLRALTA
jgi:hypothetical protein